MAFIALFVNTKLKKKTVQRTLCGFFLPILIAENLHLGDPAFPWGSADFRAANTAMQSRKTDITGATD